LVKFVPRIGSKTQQYKQKQYLIRGVHRRYRFIYGRRHGPCHGPFMVLKKKGRWAEFQVLHSRLRRHRGEVEFIKVL
jgi:hypothetical protein